MTPPRRISLPGWARKLGIACAVLLLLGIAGEVLVRLYPGVGGTETIISTQGKMGAGVYLADPELGARSAPSQHAVVKTLDYTYTFQTDHAGFPNPEPWPSRIDVAVLGDSLLDAPGLGIDGQLTTLLAQRLGGRLVWDFALPGAGTQHEYLMYRKYAQPLQPKLVIAVLWTTWDVDNALHLHSWLSENRPDPDYTHYRFNYRITHASGPPEETPSALERVLRFVHHQLSRSRLLRAGHREVVALLHRQGMREQFDFPNGDSVLLSVRDQERLAQGIDRPGVDMRAILFRPLEQLKAEVEGQGGRFVIMLMPSKEELYGADDFPAVLRPIQEVRKELEARALPVLDLYPIFRERGRERSPFYHADPHPNAFGEEIIADALAKWITDQKVFPAPAPAAPGTTADLDAAAAPAR
jgi:hypothetical protein